MAEMKRGDDAADHAPGPKDGIEDKVPKPGKQDAPNYDQATDDGKALSDEDVSSANDE